MRLEAKLNGEVTDLEIRSDESRVIASVGGREYELEVSEVEPGTYLIKSDGRIYEAQVSAKAGHASEVIVGTDQFLIEIVDPKRLKSAASGKSHDHGLAEIRTAMPGKVVRILAETGQAVEKGTGVIIVEAMKMQNEMRSPKDGVVKEISAAEGATVNAGEVLVVIE
jgi:biotin carboxyl carrier protein